MSKYIDLELALNELLRLYEEDVDAYGVEIPETFDYRRAREALSDLPTIEVSEDCISREWLEQEIERERLSDTEPDIHYGWNIALDKVVEIIKNAPSVVPCCDNEKSNKLQQELQQAEVTTEQSSKVGEWIESEIPNELYVCSECGGACWSYDWDRTIVKSYYCPNCGAKMKG